MTIRKTLLTTVGLATVVAGLGLTNVTANADTVAPNATPNHAKHAAPAYQTNPYQRQVRLGAPAAHHHNRSMTNQTGNNTTSKKTNTSSNTSSSNSSTSSTSTTSSSSSSSKASGATITESEFETQGVVYLNGNKWTYYSGNVTADGTKISSDGLDSNGYRVVAAPSSVPFGTKIMTPLGMGVVHDRGAAITGNHYDVVIQ